MRQKDSVIIKSEANIGNIMEQQDLKSVTEASNRQKSLNEKSSGDEEGGDQGDDADEIIDRKTRSRATTNKAAAMDPDKIWTTEELLADEDLWRVTDSSEDDSAEEEQKTTPKEQRKESAPAALNSASSATKNNPDLALAATAAAA